MKHIETFAITIPDEILLNSEVNSRMSDIKSLCSNKLLEKNWDTSVIVIKARNAKLILGFLSSTIWFIGGVPGKMKMFNLDEFNTTNTWLYCYEAIDRIPLVSEAFAEVVNFIYTNRETMFNEQKGVKNEQLPHIEVNVSKGKTK